MTSKNLSQKAKQWIEKHPILTSKQHQLSGVEWCLERETIDGGVDCGGILADEMGLGKTILMIAAMVANPKPHTLIVVPPALASQWKSAIERFAPILCNNGEVSIFKNTNYSKIPDPDLSDKSWYMDIYDLEGSKVWITTYGMIASRKDKKWTSPLWESSIQNSCKRENIPEWKWDRIIYDEAHHLRNRRSKKFYGAKQLGGNIKWFVTGTPVQNSDSDFVSLLLLLGVGVMSMGNGDWIKNYVLGRTKKSVGIEMPSKTEHDIPVLLTPEDKKEYDMAIQIHDRFQFQDVTIENVDRIIAELFQEKDYFAVLTAARQCCILPEMVSRKAFNFAMTNGLDLGAYGGSVNTHKKLTAISNHITDNKKKGLKLVFTHYRDEIDRLKLLLARNGITSSVLDGRTKPKDRKNILKTGSFRGYAELALARTKLPYDLRNKIMSYLSPDVLLVQIKSGNEGLNLQSYSEVYFTSPHWNPAVEDQAVARAHRIGQTKNVNVYRFITKLEDENTISLEEYCRVVQNRKRELMNYVSSKTEKL